MSINHDKSNERMLDQKSRKVIACDRIARLGKANKIGEQVPIDISLIVWKIKDDIPYEITEKSAVFST